jgi:hypothetical protein
LVLALDLVRLFIIWLCFISSPLWGDDNDCQVSEGQIEMTDIDVTQTKEEKTAPDSTKKEGADKFDKDDAKTEEVKPPKIGNFALPPSQQPAALFGFGGNIIEKGEIQLFFFADDLVGKRKIVSDLIPSVLFGITDNLSILFDFPFTPIMQDGHNISRGLEDFFIQLEYAFYNKSTYTYTDQVTVLANITAPTGSIKRNPPTGFGSPSFFIAGTYYRTWVDWFVFTAPGAILTTSDHGTKFGNQFLYQFGVGRNFPSPEGWIYAWMFEVDGQYNKKNRIDGKIDDNSGGNTIWVTPSLWVSSKEMLLQFGLSFPVNQNLFGKQRKFDYALNLNFGWSFY